MTGQQTPSAKYHVDVKDARGLVVGEHNVIYQYFVTNEAYRPLASRLYTFSYLIEEKTRNFVGRQFVFNALDTFLRQHDRGYFVVRGEPGIGKTSFMAQLVKTRGYIHHFNDSLVFIVKADQFVQNVAVQLIARYQLDRAFSPFEAGRNGGYLTGLLAEASEKLNKKEQLVIAVDALDEAERPSGGRGNVLSLPVLLPPRVFFVVTHRPIEDFPLSLPPERQHFYLEADSEGNMLDVRRYLEQVAGRLQARLQAERVSRDQFVRDLLEASEGNFMYLRHVVPKLEAGEYPGFRPQDLPQGLVDYYERHWRQMRTMDEDLWVESRQPIISFLAATPEPVSAVQLAEFSGLPLARVKAALRDWREFLSVELIDEVKKYRIYHASFQDFLLRQDEVGEIDLSQSHSQIADRGLDQWRQRRGR